MTATEPNYIRMNAGVVETAESAGRFRDWQQHVIETAHEITARRMTAEERGGSVYHGTPVMVTFRDADGDQHTLRAERYCGSTFVLLIDGRVPRDPVVTPEIDAAVIAAAK